MKRKDLYLSTIDPNAHILAKRHGLGLEIAEFCTAYFMDDRFGEVEPVLQEKMRCADRFVLHAPFNELFPCAIDPVARELAAHRYRQAMGLAVKYGAEKIVIHGGYNPRIYYRVWYTEQSVLFWRDFLKEVPEGITVCLENVLEEEPSMLLDIIRGVDDPRLKLCLDIGHINAYSKVPVPEWIETCQGQISHFHVHNNDGTWDTHSALTDGTVCMERFFALARELCPEASYTLELQDAETSLNWLLDRKKESQ